MQRYRLPLTREVPIPSDEEARLPQPIAYYYLASEVDAFMTAAGLKNWATQTERITELEKALQGARELMRELWRAEGNVSDELAARCKGFMGGG